MLHIPVLSIAYCPLSARVCFIFNSFLAVVIDKQKLAPIWSNLEINKWMTTYKKQLLDRLSASCLMSHGRTCISNRPSPPGDFVTREKQINSQIRFNFDVELCRPVPPHNQILCLHHFYLRSLYFQSS